MCVNDLVALLRGGRVSNRSVVISELLTPAPGHQGHCTLAIGSIPPCACAFVHSLICRKESVPQVVNTHRTMEGFHPWVMHCHSRVYCGGGVWLRSAMHGGRKEVEDRLSQPPSQAMYQLQGLEHRQVRLHVCEASVEVYVFEQLHIITRLDGVANSWAPAVRATRPPYHWNRTCVTTRG